MELGAFSISLAVKNLAASREFYRKLGFQEVMGNADQNWLILRNGTTTIGLFAGMFEQNILTFNPGWSPMCETLPRFQDVREIQRALLAQGITPVVAADEGGSGPAHVVLVDPDGNQVMLDQHVNAPTP